jgi:hypothetical protein
VNEPSAGEPQPDQPAGTQRGVQYKGAPLDSAKGPGLGCFWIQVAILVVVLVLTPLSAAWNWPLPISIVLLATMLVLLLFVGQTAIFLMRLVAADRRAAGPQRRPMRSATKTVGEIEREGARDTAAGEGLARDSADRDVDDAETANAEERHVDPDGPGGGGVRE